MLLSVRGASLLEVIVGSNSKTLAPSGMHPYHFLLSAVVDRGYSTAYGKIYSRGRLFDVQYQLALHF